MHTMPNFIAYSIDINKIFDIPAEFFQLYSEKLQTLVDVPLPRSHNGVGPVTCRLMSAKPRQGMVKIHLALLELKETCEVFKLALNDFFFLFSV